MSDWRINAVDTEKSATGLHVHISAVQASICGLATGGIKLSLAFVVSNIRQGKERYYTEAAGRRASAHLVGCPLCDAAHYLRTDADRFEANNLLSLPSIPKAA